MGTPAAERGKWMALTAALLGWMFDGLEQGLFPLVARPALRDLLAGLPADLRFRVLEVRLDGSSFALDGQVRSHGDADAIAASLRAGGFWVDPPSTEQLSGSPDGAEAAERGPRPVVTDLTGRDGDGSGHLRSSAPGCGSPQRPAPASPGRGYRPWRRRCRTTGCGKSRHRFARRPPGCIKSPVRS